MPADIECYGTLWQDVATALETVAEDVTGHVVEGAGHWISDEQPVALAAILGDFLAA